MFESPLRITTCCSYCDRLFYPRKSNQQYCCTKCRRAAWRRLHPQGLPPRYAEEKTLDKTLQDLPNKPPDIPVAASPLQSRFTREEHNSAQEATKRGDDYFNSLMRKEEDSK